MAEQKSQQPKEQPKPEPGKPVAASVPDDGAQDDGVENMIPHVNPE